LGTHNDAVSDESSLNPEQVTGASEPGVRPPAPPSWPTPQEPQTVGQQQPSWPAVPQSQPSWDQHPQPSWGQQPQTSWDQQPQSAWDQQPQPAWSPQPQPTWDQHPTMVDAAPTEPVQAQAGPVQPDPAAWPGQPDPTQPFPAQPGGYSPGVYGAPTAPPGFTPPGYPPPAYAPPPPKKKHTGLIVTLIVVAVLVVAGGAVGAGLMFAGSGKSSKTSAAGATSTPTSGAASATPTATESAGPIHSGDLRKFLIPAPSGSDPVDHPLGKKNTFTAAQESKEWDQPSDRQASLSLHNFDTGAVREWQTADNYVEVELFRFETPSSAKLFMGEDQDGTNYFEQTATESTVKNVPESFVYYTKKRDKNHNTHAFAIANCGDVTIELWVDTYGSTSLDYVGILLRKQYVKVCP
jgi:hypothetical protein